MEVVTKTTLSLIVPELTTEKIGSLSVQAYISTFLETLKYCFKSKVMTVKFVV